MASSVIQLGLTPWLGRFWTFEDMLLRRPRESDEPLLHEPFIGPPQQGDPGMNGFGEQSRRSRQNATMLSLAFFIAHLSFDGGIFPLRTETSQLKQTWKHGPDRLRTVLDECVSQDEIKESLGKNSYNAIMHCLKCFGTPDLDLRDTSVVQGILTHVIWPLQREKASTS
ncbi:hypothetical protein KC332_g3292 [Hortaea werneckii]|nr:hypothetical protein KC358_g13954 [Hortaea werneckii]KAI6808082.1 hypothetical protein KC350_g13481 [Hortaea werneckii]KAI6925198.1 hypothetical protein KC341_g13588 [Hortaea werneckii]KAI6932529.1 hypothetical protein KC348_g6968 [Hortaea werneckii]KAI6958752.1 hypothetical protein KC321_g13831 [Hortaea werneckii]